MAKLIRQLQYSGMITLSWFWHRKEGHEVQVRVTYEDGDNDRFVGEALEDKGYDVIVAAGGDGSVNEVSLTSSG